MSGSGCVVIIVKYPEVLYVESMKDYSKIIRVNKKPLVVKQSITTLEEVLPANLFCASTARILLRLIKELIFPTMK